MPLVQLPDGTLAHFAEDASPEELRKYVIPDLPDALRDQEPAPGVEPAAYVPYRRSEDIDALDLPLPGTPMPPPKPTNWYDNRVVQGLSGLNEGIAYGLGAPVDWTNLGLGALAAGLNGATGSNFQWPTDTFGGSQTFLQLLAPTIAPESDDPGNQILRRSLQEVGSTIIPSGIDGRFARTGRAVANELTPIRTLATDATTAAGAGMAAGFAQQVAPDNPYAELVAQILGGAATTRLMQGAERAITPFPIDPSRRAANEMMAKEGVDLAVGQWTDTPWLRQVQSDWGGVPAATFNENQLEQFTQAALAKAGIRAPRATPQVITRAYDEIGAQLDAVAARHQLKPDEQLLREFESVANSYNSAASGRTSIVEEMARTLDRFERYNWPISGDAYRNMRSRMREVLDDEDVPGRVSLALKRLQAALDDAMERSMLAAESPDIGDWQQARSDYRTLMILQDAAGQDGLISPQLLETAVSSNHPHVLVQGGELPMLAQAGKTTMTPMPESEKWRVLGLNLGIPAGLGATLGYNFSGDLIDQVPAAAAGAVAGTVVSDAARRLLHSDPVFGYLTNQLLTEPSDVAKLLVAPSIGGVINFAQPDDPDPPLSILVEAAQVRQ